MLRTIGAVALAVLVAWGALAGQLGVAHAAGPQDDLGAADAIVLRALTAAQQGDYAQATREYKAFENRWFEIEDAVRESSRDSYRAIEQRMGTVNAALSQQPPQQAAVVQALTALDAELKRFVSGEPPPEASPVATTSGASAAPTVTTLLALLASTREAVQAGDFATAPVRFGEFSRTWIDVEGEIKTRSSSDYRDTENDMARVSTALAAKSVDAVAILDAMVARLKPYETAASYGPFDAAIILLREGLEALLVVVALLAFVRKSGNADKVSWIWAGAAAGVSASVALGLAINAILGQAFSGENREILEGITGLLAAVMLLYVSYWLHSKSSLGAWQRYIAERTTRALARGSLIGLALLSFLAVFREGGETVLFLLGMVGKITLSDLALGLGAGAAVLVATGVALTVLGLRLPMRPFFTVASVLTFYLCFKFLGTGIHALQVAGLLAATTADFLPESVTLGLYPTYQTTVPQFVLLATGIALFVRTRVRDRATPRVRTSAARE